MCGVVYGGTYVWLDGSPLRGLGRVCSGVLGPCGGRQVGILFCRCPVCGITVCRYAPWCKTS